MKTQNNTGAIIALAAAIREQANTLILRSLSERGITDILPAHGAVLHALSLIHIYWAFQSRCASFLISNNMKSGLALWMSAGASCGRPTLANPRNLWIK